MGTFEFFQKYGPPQNPGRIPVIGTLHLLFDYFIFYRIICRHEIHKSEIFILQDNVVNKIGSIFSFIEPVFHLTGLPNLFICWVFFVFSCLFKSISIKEILETEPEFQEF